MSGLVSSVSGTDVATWVAAAVVMGLVVRFVQLLLARPDALLLDDHPEQKPERQPDPPEEQN